MNKGNNRYSNFDQYLRQGEPHKREKADIWRTAIGLQQVDGLTPSDFLIEKAQENIEGTITLDEVEAQIRSYYVSKVSHSNDEADTEEADRVSTNIARILSSRTFSFNTNGYIATHRRVFEGVFKHAGKVRDYDISKKEWVLDGDSVSYLNWEDLRRALDYDIEQEKDFSYQGLSNDSMIAHLTKFTSGLWQIHAFCEGNTRTTAVFLIQYLRSIGFEVNNDLFARHSWYFRNALVRANYKNVQKGIEYTPVYLERFLRNLLLGDGWDLRNRYLHICPPDEWKEQPNLTAPEQVPEQAPEQVNNLFQTDNDNIKRLVLAIGNNQMSVKEMMEAVNLKHRPNFLEYSLTPAINEGWIRMLYPESPRHPRQKYLLTVKGMGLFNNNKLLKNIIRQ